MQIQFKTTGEGGFYAPGLSKPLVVDTDDLPDEEAGHVKQLVEKAGFFNLPSRAENPSLLRDATQYTVAIQDGERQNTVHLEGSGSSQNNPHVQELIGYLQQRTKAARAQMRAEANGNP